MVPAGILTALIDAINLEFDDTEIASNSSMQSPREDYSPQKNFRCDISDGSFLRRLSEYFAGIHPETRVASIVCDIIALISNNTEFHNQLKDPSLGFVDTLVHLANAAGSPVQAKSRQILQKLKHSVDGIDLGSLVDVLKNSQSTAAMKLKTCDTFRGLCLVDSYKSILASRQLELVATLLTMLNTKSCHVPTAKILDCLQSLAKTKSSNTLPMASPSYDFLSTILDELRSQPKESTSVSIGCSLICTLLAYDRRNVQYIMDAGTHLDALKFIREAGLNPLRWGGNNTPQGWSMYIIMLCAAVPEVSLRPLSEAGMMEVVGPIVAYNHLIGLMAVIAVAFLANEVAREVEVSGSNSTSSLVNTTSAQHNEEENQAANWKSLVPRHLNQKEISSAPNNRPAGGYSELLQSNPEVVERLVNLFDDALHNRKGPGYCERTFMLSTVIRAVRCMIINNISIEALVTTRLLGCLHKIVKVFAAGLPMGNEAIDGGDIECMQYCLDCIQHILVACTEATGTLHYTRGDCRDLLPSLCKMEFSLRQLSNCRRFAMLTASTQSMVNELIFALEQLDSFLDTFAEHTIIRAPIVYNALGAPIEEGHYGVEPLTAVVANGKRPGGTDRDRKHIVISGIAIDDHGINKMMLTSLEDSLRLCDYDVWTSSNGSSLLPIRTQNPRDPAVEAIDRSCATIILLSTEYLSCVSCRMEALYAETRAKQNKLTLVYVLLEQNAFHNGTPSAQSNNIAAMRVTPVKGAVAAVGSQSPCDIWLRNVVAKSAPTTTCVFAPDLSLVSFVVDNIIEAVGGPQKTVKSETTPASPHHSCGSVHNSQSSGPSSVQPLSSPSLSPSCANEKLLQSTSQSSFCHALGKVAVDASRRSAYFKTVGRPDLSIETKTCSGGDGDPSDQEIPPNESDELEKVLIRTPTALAKRTTPTASATAIALVPTVVAQPITSDRWFANNPSDLVHEVEAISITNAGVWSIGTSSLPAAIEEDLFDRPLAVWEQLISSNTCTQAPQV